MLGSLGSLSISSPFRGASAAELLPVLPVSSRPSAPTASSPPLLLPQLLIQLLLLALLLLPPPPLLLLLLLLAHRFPIPGLESLPESVGFETALSLGSSDACSIGPG